MKIFQRYSSEFLKIYVPIILIILGLLITAPSLFHHLLYLNLIFLILLILLFLRRLPHGPETGFSGYIKTFLMVSLIQFSLAAIAFSENTLFFQLIPFTDNISTENFSAMYQRLFQQELLHWGLFPWSLFALMSIILFVEQKKHVYTITLLDTTHLVMGKKIFGVLGVGIEVFLRQGLIFSLCFVIACLGLSVYFYISFFVFKKVYYGPTVLTFFIFLILLPLIASLSWKKLIQFFRKKLYTSSQILILQSLFIAVALVLLTLVLRFIGEVARYDMASPVFFPFTRINAVHLLHFFNWAFWLGATVYMAPLLSRMIQCKSLRFFILANVFWPLVFLLMNAHDSSVINVILNKLSASSLLHGVNLLILTAIGWYCWKEKTTEHLLGHYFYRTQYTKKKLYPVKLLQNILQILSIVCLFYLFSGIKLLTFLYVAILATNFAVFSCTGLCAVYAFNKK